MDHSGGTPSQSSHEQGELNSRALSPADSTATINARLKLNGRKFLRQLASLKWAVFVIILIAVVTAWGTFVEAKFDAHAAKKIVYDTVWMKIPLAMLCLSLLAVMADRWPWQRRHLGFIVAHVGIITLLVGSWVTQKFGIDGSVTLGLGEAQKSVTVGETDLVVLSSLDGTKYRTVFQQEVDFFSHPVQKEPLVISIPEGDIRILESHPYALREQRFVDASDELQAGAAIRFQLQNPNVNVAEWILQPSKDASESKDFGPAQVLIVPKFPRDFGGRNAIVLKPNGDRIDYQLHSRRAKEIRSRSLKAGDSVDTGWMGIQFRVLKYLPKGKEQISYRPVERPSEATTAAIRVEYQPPGSNKVTAQWMGLNSLLKLFSEQQVYILSYANRRLPLGFPLKLKDFRVGRYQGTMRAASYESVVDVPGVGESLISMNEPLKHGGFTFYQASFSSDPSGKPVASVLSVNFDPGRGLKYFGSLLIVLGTLHLFYLKRRAWLKKGTVA